MAYKKVFVSPDEGGWRVQTVGTSRAAGIFETKIEAVEKGREVAIHNSAELFVQGKDGKIQWRNSYGKDPFPPRG